jgi:ferritin-like protein
MKSATNLGSNRTGLATSPALAAALVEATRETVPSARGDARTLAAVRIDYAKVAEPVGSMPPPASLKEAAKTVFKALRGQKATVLLDKLGERLAFERSGVRLYDALISKLEAFGSWAGGPSLAELENIRSDERNHFLLVKSAMEEMGSDPTAVTPSANAQAVISKGLPALLGDPRTDLRQGLEAILVAELVDNDGWENLINLARALGQDELAARMDRALQEEQDHLRRVRRWLTAALSNEAGAGRMESLARERGKAPAEGGGPQRGRRSGRRLPSSGSKRSVRKRPATRKRARRRMAGG